MKCSKDIQIGTFTQPLKIASIYNFSLEKYLIDTHNYPFDRGTKAVGIAWVNNMDITTLFSCMTDYKRVFKIYAKRDYHLPIISPSLTNRQIYTRFLVMQRTVATHKIGALTQYGLLV